MLTSLSPSPKGFQSPKFSDSDFREVRGLGLGRPKSSADKLNLPGWVDRNESLLSGRSSSSPLYKASSISLNRDLTLSVVSFSNSSSAQDREESVVLSYKLDQEKLDQRPDLEATLRWLKLNWSSPSCPSSSSSRGGSLGV
jgi:hypothetical protein